MSEEWKDMAETPVLTLEPMIEEEKQELVEAEPAQIMEVQPEMNPVQKEMAQTKLTEAEQKIVNEFAEKIDIENTAQILQYGAGTQKKMADFSDAALENVRTQDLGSAGDLIADVVGELQSFDAEEEKGFFKFFKKQAKKIETMKNRFSKAEVNVTKICDALEQHQVRLMKDTALMDKMYQQNLNYFKELSMYILAGKKKLQDVRNGKLRELEEKARMTGRDRKSVV